MLARGNRAYIRRGCHVTRMCTPVADFPDTFACYGAINVSNCVPVLGNATLTICHRTAPCYHGFLLGAVVVLFAYMCTCIQIHKYIHVRMPRTRMFEYTVYTRRNCSYCARVKTLLPADRTQYIDVTDEDRTRFLEDMDRRTPKPHRTFPFVFRGETFIGGCDDTEAHLAFRQADF